MLTLPRYLMALSCTQNPSNVECDSSLCLISPPTFIAPVEPRLLVAYLARPRFFTHIWAFWCCSTHLGDYCPTYSIHFDHLGLTQIFDAYAKSLESVTSTLMDSLANPDEDEDEADVTEIE